MFWADSLLGRQCYHAHLTDEKVEARWFKNPEPKCWAGVSQDRAWRCMNPAWNCWCMPHCSLLWLGNQRLVPPTIWELQCHRGRNTFRDGEVPRAWWIHFLQISEDINLIYTGSIFLFHEYFIHLCGMYVCTCTYIWMHICVGQRTTSTSVIVLEHYLHTLRWGLIGQEEIDKLSSNWPILRYELDSEPQGSSSPPRPLQHWDTQHISLSVQPYLGLT